MTRLFSGIFFCVFGFPAPTVLPLSPNVSTCSPGSLNAPDEFESLLANTSRGGLGIYVDFDFLHLGQVP